MKNKALDLFHKNLLKANTPIITVEQMQKRYEQYIKADILFSCFLPKFILKGWKIKWWIRSLEYATVLFAQQEITFEEAAALLAEKNAVYGNRSLQVLGTPGIALRSVDKFCRIANIRENSHLNCLDLVQKEGTRDSIMDVGNYCILAILLLREEL